MTIFFLHLLLYEQTISGEIPRPTRSPDFDFSDFCEIVKTEDTRK